MMVLFTDSQNREKYWFEMKWLGQGRGSIMGVKGEKVRICWAYSVEKTEQLQLRHLLGKIWGKIWKYVFRKYCREVIFKAIEAKQMVPWERRAKRGLRTTLKNAFLRLRDA